MKKINAILFVSAVLTFAACTAKPKTEEAGVDSNAMMATDTTAMTSDSTTTPDSASTMATDSAN